MGDEIEKQHFKKKDYLEFEQRLLQETKLLHRLFFEQQFSDGQPMAGFEQEAWFVNSDCDPSPGIEAFIQNTKDSLVTPELSTFNIELNVEPMCLQGDVFSQLLGTFSDSMQAAQKTAALNNERIVMIGILPTVNDSHLILENMSPLNRYHALNEQVLHGRKGKPLNLDIVGEEHLQSQHMDVMLESAATSFQIHRQIPASQARRYYNASIVVSAPMVAVAANSPYLFGKHLWEESRIPLFEQAVEVGGFGSAAEGPVRRVSFGSGYAQQSILECFDENLEHFPILLPMILDQPPEDLAHLRLHNGTIWRWNRPLIGVNNGKFHLRTEHRTIAAGPTVVDEIANAAFFYGLQEYLANSEVAPELINTFSQVKDNFYQAARFGLQAQIYWDGKKQNLRHLILNVLLPVARSGLQKLDIDAADIEIYLGIIQARVESQQNGANWQKKYVNKNGRDWKALTQIYLDKQLTGEPVHSWRI